MRNIRSLTEETLESLIRFVMSHEVATHILGNTNENWKEFEEEFSVDYPIKGWGVLASESLISEWDFNNESIIRDEIDISGEEVSSELSTYPIDSVSIVYMFSILEVYGDEVTNIINSSFVKDRRAWHRKVYLPKNEPSYKDIEKIRRGFAEPFNANSSDVKFNIAAALAQLKNARNLIVHKNNGGYNFKMVLSAIVAIICHIDFLASKETNMLKVYPWEDYDDVFK